MLQTTAEKIAGDLSDSDGYINDIYENEVADIIQDAIYKSELRREISTFYHALEIVQDSKSRLAMVRNIKSIIRDLEKEKQT